MNTQSLATILGHPTTGFQNGWRDGYTKEELRSELKNRSNATLKEIHYDLNKSILCGTYLNETTNEFRSMKNLIWNNSIQINKNKNSYDLPQELSNDIAASIDLYTEFLIDLNNADKKNKAYWSNSVGLIESMSFGQDSNMELIRFRSNTSSLYNYRILAANIDVALIDHFLSCDGEIHNHLVRIITFLSNKNIQTIGLGPPNIDYVDILKDKASFLLKKIESQLVKRNKSTHLIQEESGERVYESKYFKSVSDIFDLYNEQNQEKIITQYKKIPPKKEYSYTELYTIIRYAKEIEKDIARLREISNDFAERFKEDASSKEKHIFNTFSIYINNNIFSMQINSFLELHQSMTIEDLKSEVKSIEKMQGESNTHNYFLYYKAAEIACKKLQHILENEAIERKISDSELLLLADLLRNWITKLKVAFKWCKDNSFQVIHLPKEECYINNSIINEKLFLSSSFIHPIDYELIHERIEELRYDSSIQIGVAQMIFAQRKQRRRIEQDRTELVEKIKNSRIDSITILSIFGTITFFSLGSLQIFLKPTDVHIAFGYMLALAAALSLFAALIWMITQNRLSLSAVLVLIITLALGLTSYYQSERYQKTLEGKLDSLLQLNQPSPMPRDPTK